MAGYPTPSALLRYSGRLARVSESAFRFREEAELWRATVLVLGFAGLTGLAAQVSFSLPFTPVPVTGQVFAVLLAGAALGRRLGPLSQAVYVGLGALGLPWFASSGAAPFSVGGWSVVVGASGGYLIGFIVASALVGLTVDRAMERRSFTSNLLALYGGLGVIYLFGAVQLAIVAGLSARDAVLYGVLPFLPLDMLKCVLAALAILPLVPPLREPSGRPSDSTSRIRPRDYGLFLLTLAFLWCVAALVASYGSATPLLLDWYVLAAAAGTGCAVGALAIRAAVWRALEGAAPIRVPS